MAVATVTGLFDQRRLAANADGVVVAVAVSLPWSTSATSILLVIWLVALIPTLQLADLRRELSTAAGGLPVLLFLLGALGMAWADVSLMDRLGGLDGFIKLLIIPLLMVQFRRSDKGRLVFIGFLLSCVTLLIASSIVGGAPVKNYIAQSDEFTVCAAILIGLAVEKARTQNWPQAAAMFVLSCAFLANIFFLTTSRTTLVVLSALVIAYGVGQLGWKGLFAGAAAWLVLAGLLWTASPYVRGRVVSIYSQTEQYEARNAKTSAGLRIDFWTKSVRFIEAAPLLGRGTGSNSSIVRTRGSRQFRCTRNRFGQSTQSDTDDCHPGRPDWRGDSLGDVDFPVGAV